MSILDELKATENKLRGIKAKHGEGNGYNTPGGKKKITERIGDAVTKRKLTKRNSEK